MNRLIEYLTIGPGKSYFRVNYVYKHFFNKEIEDFCKNRNFSFKELCFRIHNNVDLQKDFYCKICGKKLLFNGHGYDNSCSKKCSSQLAYQTICKNNKIKYGVEHTLSLTEVRTKIKIKKKQKYNNENYNNSLKTVQTKLNDIDENGLNIFERSNKKAMNTMRNDIDEFGYNMFKRKAIKAKETGSRPNENNISNYQLGALKVRNKRLNDIDENGLNSYQRASLLSKNTNYIKYGQDSYAKTKQFKEYMIEHNLEKYHVPYYFQSDEYKYKKQDPEWVNNLVNHLIETKRKNNTFNKSKPEQRILLKLKTLYKDVIYNYKDITRYPFLCDFYIPSLDLFIELNFHWTHGKEPFDKNNEKHLEIINLWKNKIKPFYKHAIYVWTDLDVRKLQTFKKNNLNYRIFYNEKQFNEWFNSL